MNITSTKFVLLILVLLSVSGFTKSPEDRLRSEVKMILDAYSFPGMTVTFYQGNESYSVAVGFANIETGEQMGTDTPMLAASIGKTFVATTCLQLNEIGLLDLDDPISNWLEGRDWFARLPNGESITVRHLLQHTSGLPDHVHLPVFAEIGVHRASELGPEGLIKLILEEAPLFPPGEGWSYSDTGYLILGLIIEKLSKAPYEDLVNEQILLPYKLAQTGPSNRINIPRLARGYVSPASGLNLPKYTTDAAGVMLWNPKVEWTGGGLYSTAEDLAKWGYELFSGNLLEKSLFAQMTKGVLTSDSDQHLLYGLGVAIQTESDLGPVLGHRGWIPGYVSSLQYYPDHDFSIAFQINTDIGIIDVEEPVVSNIENQLATIFIAVLLL